MLRERNVIVDPGWRTFDWVVTQSLKVLDKRSDAVNKGMFAVVHLIADAIGAELGSRLSRAVRGEEAASDHAPVWVELAG